MKHMEKTARTYTAWGIDNGIHETRGIKPMLTPEEQVELLKTKGVTFARCTETEATSALTERGTFLHIASYRNRLYVLVPGEVDGRERVAQGVEIRSQAS